MHAADVGAGVEVAAGTAAGAASGAAAPAPAGVPGHLPHVVWQKLPLSMKGALHLPKPLCRQLSLQLSHLLPRCCDAFNTTNINIKMTRKQHSPVASCQNMQGIVCSITP